MGDSCCVRCRKLLVDAGYRADGWRRWRCQRCGGVRLDRHDRPAFFWADLAFLEAEVVRLVRAGVPLAMTVARTGFSAATVAAIRERLT